MACGEQTIREALMCLVSVLDDGPDLFEWVTLFALPVLVATTTTLIAIGSWRTASKATAISEAALRAEEARAREQTDLARRAADDQYAARLDSHFAAFFEAVGQFAHETDEWVDQAADLERHWPGDPDDTPYPPRPSRALLDARLQAAMLHARGDDRTVLGKIDGYVRAVVRSESTWKLSHRLAFLMELIRRWRDGSVTSETSMSRLKRKRSAVESNRDRPPRRER